MNFYIDYFIINLMKNILLAFMVASQVQADTVCSEKNLKLELREDMKGDRKLDCIRATGYFNNLDNKAMPAHWSSDCAFEAEYDWHQKLVHTYGLAKG